MFQLSDSDQELLLQIAREAVWAHLAGQSPLVQEITSGVLSESHAIFVSIHKGSELRGCIGNVQPSDPLYRSAAECAISAAVGDPRFPPLTGREVSDVVFEISVLSTMERVYGIEQIEIGKHGLMISKRNARGLLLPQVAGACGWTPEQFLSETCRKAGLSSGEWRDGAAIFRFSALVFGEKRRHIGSSS
jgi:AmmeMemoRadiSam system protein A